MGFWLWRTFRSQTALANATSGSETFNLPRNGVISNIIMETYMLSGTTKASIMSAAAFTKIEVVGNGSTVIQSLTGKQLQASQALDDGRFSNDKELSPSGGCYAYFDIRFGRYPGDPLYALDCGKWNSLELKVTYDLAAGGTVDTTGYATTTGKLGLYGLYSPDGAGMSPIGYLKKEQKKTYTTSAGGTEDLELPTDYPYRRLILSHTTNYYPSYSAFQYVTVNINNGARKPIDNLPGNDLMQMDQAMRGYPLFTHIAEYYLSGGDDLFPPLGFVISASYFSEDNTLVGGDIGVGHVHVHAGGACSGYVNSMGYGPGKSLCIDLEKWSGGKHGLDAMMDVFGYDQHNDIHLEHTQQNASIASSIVLEQYAS